MTDHPTGPSEIGAPMDYPEHEKTYGLFLAGAKYLSLWLAALLLAMTAGFFGHAGLLGGVAIFFVLGVIGTFLAR